MSMGQNFGCNQESCNQGNKGECPLRPDFAKCPKSDKAAYHRSKPVDRHVSCCVMVTHTSHRGLAEEVDHDAADCYLGSDVEKDGECTQAEMTKAPSASIGVGSSIAPFDQVRKADKGRDNRHCKGTGGQ